VIDRSPEDERVIVEDFGEVGKALVVDAVIRVDGAAAERRQTAAEANRRDETDDVGVRRRYLDVR